MMLRPWRDSRKPPRKPIWNRRQKARTTACSQRNLEPSFSELGVTAPIGAGTWTWGNKLLWGYSPEMDPKLKEGFAVLKRNGVSFFDTADSYGTGQLEGRGEKLLGDFSTERKDESEPRTVAATKLAPYPWRLTGSSLVAAYRRSLQRLGNDVTPIAQLHWSTSRYFPPQDYALWDGLQSIHHNGLAHAVGVSNYGPKGLRKVHSWLKARGVPLVSVQVQYSLLSRYPEWEGLTEAAKELGVQVIAYSPLALGILTGKYGADNPLPGLRGFGFTKALRGSGKLLECMNAMAGEKDASASQIAIAWLVHKGAFPIPGFKDPSQAQQNVGAMAISLGDSEVTELDRVSSGCPQTQQNPFSSS